MLDVFYNSSKNYIKLKMKEAITLTNLGKNWRIIAHEIQLKTIRSY